jgi:hypothetical protein
VNDRTPISVGRETAKKENVEMKLLGSALTALALALAAAAPAAAHEPENLKVLAKDHTEKEVEKGMKAMTKGLGVKCEACHVKGKMHADDVKAKEAARTFLKATMGEKDAAKRKAALDELLKALELKAAKAEAGVWQAVDGWKKQ